MQPLGTSERFISVHVPFFRSPSSSFLMLASHIGQSLDSMASRRVFTSSLGSCLDTSCSFASTTWVVSTNWAVASVRNSFTDKSGIFSRSQSWNTGQSSGDSKFGLASSTRRIDPVSSPSTSISSQRISSSPDSSPELNEKLSRPRCTS